MATTTSEAFAARPVSSELKGPRLARQPLKGLFFTVVCVPFGGLLWLLLVHAFGLDWGPATTVFTVCFVYFWQIGWSFGGWPGRVFTSSRWARGAINWVLLMVLVLLSIRLWSWYYDRPFQDTEIGLWAQTTIIAGVVSLFFFGNTLLLPEQLANKQPLGGFVNLLWGVLFVPFGLLYVLKLDGGSGLYIPWIWFPVALVFMSYFDGKPLDQLGQPRAGIAYCGAVFAATMAFLAVLHLAGTDFFASGNDGLKAAIFGAIWTNVGLVLAWLFNMWPIGDWPQPLKGFTATAGTLALSALVYVVFMITVASSALEIVLFGQFAFMWAQVSLAGVGLFNVFQWGYEDDPGGAGAGLLRNLTVTPAESTQTLS